jgi:hypothetical protein
MVYGLFCALPGVHELLVTVIGAMREHRRRLGTSQGVPEPRSFAVRFPRPFAYDRKASIASRPAFVTMAKRPSCRDGTAQTIRLILPSEKQKSFCRRGLTRFLQNRSSGKSVASKGTGASRHLIAAQIRPGISAQAPESLGVFPHVSGKVTGHRYFDREIASGGQKTCSNKPLRISTTFCGKRPDAPRNWTTPSRPPGFCFSSILMILSGPMSRRPNWRARHTSRSSTQNIAGPCGPRPRRKTARSITTRPRPAMTLSRMSMTSCFPI